MIASNQHNLWADQPMTQSSDTSDTSHATSEGVADRLVYPPHSATTGPHHPHSHPNHQHQHHNETFLTIPRRSHNNNLNHDLVPMSTNSNSRFVDVPFHDFFLLNKSPLGSLSFHTMLGTKKKYVSCVFKNLSWPEGIIKWHH